MGKSDERGVVLKKLDLDLVEILDIIFVIGSRGGRLGWCYRGGDN